MILVSISNSKGPFDKKGYKIIENTSKFIRSWENRWDVWLYVIRILYFRFFYVKTFIPITIRF